MTAFVVVEIQIIDPENYEMVKKLTPPIVAQYGGKYLARGGETLTLEGQWNPKRLVIIEFDSMDQAKAWWNSNEYTPVKQMRQQFAITNMVLTEGNPIIY
ncbi:MAG: DUF1330 domain-containing protein [Chloroflexi bacterium HGW-Chloroflexi-8]|jgi:uncharacterized protein (DUF1330 family)|nr:MAG: DUF1330 domain-containing protein [Chloroflexi bacterium HGW-Chloroflexi-8]